MIEVYDNMSTRASFKTVRDVLTYTTNITRLTLHFSSKPSSQILPISLVFKRLTTLDINIPHATVGCFLVNHPRITNLVLGPCNTQLDFCPLTCCHLPNLWELTCPPGCVRALTNAHSPLTQLSVIHGTDQDVNFPLFNFMHIRTSSVLTILHLDFDHTIKRLLNRISVAAPALRVLKLTERRLSGQVRYSV